MWTIDQTDTNFDDERFRLHAYYVLQVILDK